jgi:hypothetical protein
MNEIPGSGGVRADTGGTRLDAEAPGENSSACLPIRCETGRYLK